MPTPRTVTETLTIYLYEASGETQHAKTPFEDELKRFVKKFRI